MSLTKYEQFVLEQIQPRLQPGEQILHMATLFNKSLALAALTPLAMLGEGYFLVAATDRRLFPIKTKMGLWSLKRENLGINEMPYYAITNIDDGGVINQRTIKFTLNDGNTYPFRLNTLARFTAGQKTFIDNLKQLVSIAHQRQQYRQ